MNAVDAVCICSAFENAKNVCADDFVAVVIQVVCKENSTSQNHVEYCYQCDLRLKPPRNKKKTNSQRKQANSFSDNHLNASQINIHREIHN